MSNTAYSVKEEVANAISHGVGLILGIVGLVLLLVKAVDHRADALTIVSMSIYGGSMIALFLASTLYHAIPHQNAKRWLKTFDHCAIYLLIAGSYTPFLLVSLRLPLSCDLSLYRPGLTRLNLSNAGADLIARRFVDFYFNRLTCHRSLRA